MLFGKKIKNYLLLVVLGANLFVGGSSFVSKDAIWNNNKLPSTFYGRLTKISLVGFFTAFVSWRLAGLKFKESSTFLGFLATSVSIAAAWNLSSGNTVDVWMNDLLKGVEAVATHSLLQQSAFDGNRWYASNTEIADLQLRLKEVGDDLARLISVTRVLLDCRAREFSKHQKDSLLKLSDNLNKLNFLHEYRYAWVLAAADYDTFLEQFGFVVRAGVLSEGDNWMIGSDPSGARRFVRFSFNELVFQLKKVKSLVECLEDLSAKLLGAAHANVVKESVVMDVREKMKTLAELKKLCLARLAYSVSRENYEQLNSKYSKVLTSGVSAQSPIDDESWMKSGLVYRDLNVLAQSLKDNKILFEEIISIGDSLLRQDSAIHFSEQELSAIYVKTEKSRELIRFCLQRMKIISVMQLVQGFNREVASLLADQVLSEHGSVWKNATSGQSWPLEALLQRLNASRDSVSACMSRGAQISLNQDLRVLKNSYILELQKTMSALSYALDVANQRIMFIKNSVAFAQEGQEKIAYEHALRQEKIRKKEEARRLEAERRQLQEQQRQDRIRQERERLYQQQQPAPTAPPMDVQPLCHAPTPTAPPMDIQFTSPTIVSTAPPAIVGQPEVGECFCGDDVLQNDAYVLNCSCKNSFYHKDCIQDWIKNKPTCPTCRAAVTLADVVKKDFSQPVVVAQSAPVTNPAVQSAVTPVTVVPAAQVVPAAPTLQVDADRECYFCMEVDGDCTTANCGCTVKKAACRECLQEWLDAHHTCPRCQKEGATLVGL
jgi:hypothetical protein